MNIKICKWKDSYADDFYRLSVEWLEKYVRVEPADLQILKNPHEAVLDNGGMIFFACDGEKPVGTVSVINIGNGVCELAKLAVTETYKGNKIGDLLMKTAVSFATENGMSKVILFTNSKLKPAISLYKKFGFEEVPLVDNEYEESDMKMELHI